MISRKKHILFSSLALIVFSIVLSLETKNFPLPHGRDIGPAFWPKILIGLLFVFSAILLIQTIFSKSYDTVEPAAKKEKKSFKPLLGILSVILFVILFKPLGFVLSILIFYILSNLILRENINLKTFLIIVAQSLSLTLIIYLLFVQLLSVSLPAGIFDI